MPVLAARADMSWARATMPRAWAISAGLPSFEFAAQLRLAALGVGQHLRRIEERGLDAPVSEPAKPEGVDSGVMPTFHLFIRDERQPAPTLAVVTVRSADRALELARQRLKDSPHHFAVEVHEGDELVARIERDGDALP